jgi:hypothetical protein
MLDKQFRTFLEEHGLDPFTIKRENLTDEIIRKAAPVS